MRLRTQHVAYVRHVAERDDISVSHAVRRIISTHAGVLDPTQISRQENLHVTIESENMTLLNCVSQALGMERSDIMRRLIDKAMAEDPILRLA